ncbi:hypothetical protein B0H10DRAFT_1791636, partial [Mycena sp. CBHHK59/15]
HFPAFHQLPCDYDLDMCYYSDTGSAAMHWCFSVKIKTKLLWFRPMYRVKDRAGLEYLVAFHLDDRLCFLDIYEKCKEGFTMCIMYTNQHLFVDGQQGIHVEVESTVKVLPCILQKLMKTGDKLKENNGCCTVTSMKCSKCKMCYCSKKCQLKDWNGRHKVECRVAQQILKWGEFDWDQFDNFQVFEI